MDWGFFVSGINAGIVILGIIVALIAGLCVIGIVVGIISAIVNAFSGGGKKE